MRVIILAFILFSFQPVFSQVKVKSNDNLQTAVRKITKDATSDSLKIEAIYTWITNNIAYDYTSFLSGEPYAFQSPEKVLSRRKTTCTGYVNLMQAMLQQVGIESFEIEGMTRDVTLGRLDAFYYSTHAWLAFRCNGTWYACDPTWDSGYIGMMEKKKKNSFRLRVAGFWVRVANVFRRKSRKRQTSVEVTNIQTYFKVGFIQQPTRTYFFAPIGNFQQTHLSSVAHMQMSSDPLSVNEFLCLDSIPVKIDSIGSFPFQSVNNQFSSLDLEQRSLWMADSVLRFSKRNYTDRTIHLYNHFRMKSTVKNRNLEHIELLLAEVDSVLLNSERSLVVLKGFEQKKRAEILHHFQLERTFQRNQQVKMRFLDNLKANAKSIYDRGKNNYEMRELPYLENALVRLDFSKTTLDPDFSPENEPELVRKFIGQFDSLTKETNKLQEKTLLQGVNYIEQFQQKTSDVEMLFYHKLNLMLNRSFDKEANILVNDSLLDRELQQLIFLVRDSLIGLTASRKSMRQVMQLDKWVRDVEKSIPEWKKKYPNWDEKAFRGYLYLGLDSLFRKEINVVQDRLEKAEIVQVYLAKTGGKKLQFLQKYFQAQTQVRVKRHTHIHKELYAFINRPKKVISNIRKNAKTQKVQLNQLAREMKKTKR